MPYNRDVEAMRPKRIAVSSILVVLNGSYYSSIKWQKHIPILKCERGGGLQLRIKGIGYVSLNLC